MLAQLAENYPDDVRIVYRHFPLTSIHDKATLAAEAAEAAGAQGQFWEMHELLYETQSDWSRLPEADFRDALAAYADDLGLDVDAFNADLDDETFREDVLRQGGLAQALGLPGTPSVVINGVFYQGVSAQYWLFDAVVQVELLRERGYAEVPPIQLDPDGDYEAIFRLESGDVRVALFNDVAPIAVNSFAFLACQDWFDNTTFHRVLPGFVAQGGDPTGTGFAGPGYEFVNEVSDDVTFDRAGLLAYANSGPDTNGSQFFITYDATPDLNGGFTIFGEVIDGLDLLEDLTPRDPQMSPDLPPGDTLLGIDVYQK